MSGAPTSWTRAMAMSSRTAGSTRITARGSMIPAGSRCPPGALPASSETCLRTSSASTASRTPMICTAPASMACACAPPVMLRQPLLITGTPPPMTAMTPAMTADTRVHDGCDACDGFVQGLSRPLPPLSLWRSLTGGRGLFRRAFLSPVISVISVICAELQCQSSVISIIGTGKR